MLSFWGAVVLATPEVCSLPLATSTSSTSRSSAIR